MRTAVASSSLVLTLGGLLLAFGCSSTSNPATGTGGHHTSTASTASTGANGGSATTMTQEGTGGAVEAAMCSGCLDTKCATEKAACDDGCFAIQACLDAVCFNLSATGASDEGTCQVHCQSLHAASKAAHLAWVNCVSTGSCQPPCAGYSFDYDYCVTGQNEGACKGALDACNGSPDCTTYVACASSCSNFPDCQACGTGTGPAAGEALYEAYQLCVDHTCFAQGWLPSG